MIASKEYWKGFNDARKACEKEWESARAKVNVANHERFMDILDGAIKVKGIGERTHQALIDYVLGEFMKITKGGTENESHS